MPTAITGSWIKGWDDAMLRNCFDKVSPTLGLSDLATDTTFYPIEIAQREIAQKRGDNSLEFMNLWRTPANRNMDLQNTPLSIRGRGFGIQDPVDPQISGVLNAVSVVLPYTLTVWSKSLEVVNRVEEDWVLWPYRDPTFDIYASILGNVVPLRGSLYPGQITDNSQIAAKFADGRYYSISLAVELKASIFRITSYPYADKLLVKLYYSVDPSTAAPTELLREWEVPTE